MSGGVTDLLYRSGKKLLSYGNKVDALSTSLKPLTPGEVARLVVTERASSVSEEVGGIVGVRTRFIPTTHPLPRTTT